MTWKHADRLALDAALQLLQRVEFTLSAPLSDVSRETNGGDPVQVWFEIVRSASPTPSAIQTIPGKMSLRDNLVTWSSATDQGRLREMLGQGGRLSFRLHCGAITDRDSRPYSNSLERLVESKGPRVPGGVLESWVFVRGG